MNFSVYTNPGKWIELYAALPDDLVGLMAVVKNLVIHPVDVHRHGIRVSPRRSLVLRQLFTAERMLDDLFQTPPVSLTAERSPYQRLVEWCDYQAVLLTSFGLYRGYEIRTRCGFVSYIDRGRWINHWLNEVRRPFYEDWTLVDPDRRCFPAAEEFRSGAAWWPLKSTAAISRLKSQNYRGVDAVKYILLGDFNALNGHEMLHQHWSDPDSADRGPAIFQIPYTRLGARQRAQVDSIAAAIRDGDNGKLVALFNDEAYGGQFGLSSSAAVDRPDVEPAF